MFELSLLIFVIACSHVCYRLIIRIFLCRRSSLPFFIPSLQDLNIIWGFVFYAAAFYLLAHMETHKNIFAFLCVILFGGALCLRFYRSFFCGGFCPFAPICKKFLQKRLLTKPKQSETMTRQDAAALLGLSADMRHTETIRKQFDSITDSLQKRRFLTPELQTLLTQACNTLSAADQEK